jgi:hypothetical protein
VIGALIAAGMSYWLSQQNLRQAKKAAKEQQNDRERVVTMRTTVKLIRLTNGLRGLLNHISDCRVSAEEKGINLEIPVAYLYAVEIDPSNFIQFDVDELAVFVEARHTEFLSRIIMLGDNYNSLMGGMRQYGRLRNEFIEQFPVLIENEADAPHLTEEERLKYAPQFANLNSLAKSIMDGAAEDFEEANSIIAKYGRVVRTYFGDPAFPVPVPEDVPPDAEA